MRIYLVVIFYCILIQFSNSQPPVQVKKSKRVIRIMDLYTNKNSPFFRIEHEIPTLVMEAIVRGEIRPCYINYSNFAKEQTLTMEQYDEKISYPMRYLDGENELSLTVRFFPRDFFTIGLDQTIGVLNGKEFAQVHYVNFYSFDHYKKDKTTTYRFSVTWNDFMQVLKAHNRLLYYTNSFGNWWRGDVFLTHSTYSIDEGTGGDFIQLSKSLDGFKATDFKNPDQEYSLSHLNENNYEGYPLEFMLEERKIGDTYSISKVIIEETDPEWLYAKGKRFTFDWSKFLSIASDSAWRKNSEVYTIADAFMLQKFEYAESKEIEVSKNGKFIKGGKDPLCGYVIDHSFQVLSPKMFNTFYTNSLEGVFLGDSLNTHLHRPGSSIVELIYEYIHTGKAGVYTYDPFLKNYGTLALEEFVQYSRITIEASAYIADTYYKKGDTIEIENKYYTVTENHKAREGAGFESFKKNLKPIELPLYQARDLLPLSLIQMVTFDKEGKNKQYHLQAIGLNVPSYLTIKGIEIPLGYVKWEEVRSLLKADKRAITLYKGQIVHLVDLFESRNYFPVFYKTGLLYSND